MNNEIKLREADLSDIPILLRFEQGVVETERPFDITLKRKDTKYYDLDEMVQAPHICLLVAEINGALIASGYARIENAKPYLQHTQHAYLGFMYTVPEYRGKGVNQKIVDALKQWSHEKGIHELRLDVYHTNESAIKAYEKAGFVKHMILMRAER